MRSDHHSSTPKDARAQSQEIHGSKALKDGWSEYIRTDEVKSP
jgi:hypothetical protein